jgi:hypothetical protein
MNKKRDITNMCNVCICALLILATVGASPVKGSLGISSSYTSSAPLIDGVIGDGEWANKMPITLNGFNNPSSTKNGALYVMNDNSTLYIAVVIPDATKDADYLMLDFDQGNDHVATDGGEDATGFNVGDVYPGMPTSYADYHWTTSSWWQQDTATHGAGAMKYASNNYTYEFSKPLNSSDPQDMNLKPGEIIGFRIETWDTTLNDWYRYPQNTVDSNTARWNEWADLSVVTLQLGSLVGTLTYACNGTRIAEVPVNLTQTGTLRATTASAANGQYSFTNVPTGMYALNVSKRRYFDNSTTVRVNAGEPAVVNLTLWLKGDLNNNCIQADAGDLAKLKDASVGKIAADWKFDLNSNTINADAGDLAKLKDASVGKIDLV